MGGAPATDDVGSGGCETIIVFCGSAIVEMGLLDGAVS